MNGRTEKILGTEKRPAGRVGGSEETNLERQLERIDISKAIVARVHQCIVTMVQDTVWTSGAISRWNGSICFLGNTTTPLRYRKGACSFCP